MKLAVKVNRPQPKSVKKKPTPTKWLISPFPKMINHIREKYSLEKYKDKKTGNEICNIFQK